VHPIITVVLPCYFLILRQRSMIKNELDTFRKQIEPKKVVPFVERLSETDEIMKVTEEEQEEAL
jgi:hypothetical protein